MFGNQTKRTFVEKLDFLTTPGFLTGPGAREKAGLPSNTGPYRVISQLAVYDFDEKTKKMRLFSLHPGVTIEEVKDNCSFDLIIPAKYGISPEPSDKDLELLRKVIDPTGMLIGK
jgi:acyl CoA:acetate/3-ketoacid CoA transferase beta subunit